MPQRVDKPIDTLETVQKGVRLPEWNPKVYMYTPRDAFGQNKRKIP